MRDYFKIIFVSLVIIAGTIPAMAAGSGAYRLEVPDAGAMGKGSAFAGEANTPAAVYYNPAGMTQIVGQAVSVTAAVVEPHETYKGPGSADAVQMKRGDYLIPSLYYVTKLGTEKFALGIGTTTSWGLTTEWAPDSFAKYVATKTSMTNHDYLVALAYKVNEQWSVSAGMDIDQSKLIQEKKINQQAVLAPDGNSRLVGSDTAVGGRLAAMFMINERHQVGIMYRSAIHHQYSGKAYLNALDPIVSGAYGFGGASQYSTDVMVKSVLPQSLVLGYSYKPDRQWTINAELEWMNWSAVKRLTLTYPSESDPARLSFLNQGNPINKDWHDTLSLSMGAEYAATDKLRLRGGYYLHQSPVNKATWDPSVPDSDCLGLTTGVGYDLTKSFTVDLAWLGVYYRPRKVHNDVGDDPTVGSPVDGTYKQWINSLYATATYKF